MDKITLAIPFYNTSRYFKEATELALKSDFVREIVVSDDCSTDEESSNLNNIISELGSDKIKVYRNDKNLGGFRNKYTAVDHATSEWVYLLDSDNNPAEDTLSIIESIEDPNPDLCYVPQTLKLHKVGEDDWEINYHFKYEEIGIDEAQDALLKKTKYFDWLLNTGNFVFNRENYLERLSGGYANLDEPVYACSIAFSYHWLNNGGRYKVVPGMSYYHRLRNDSYWNSCGSNSDLSATYYHERIINLQ